MKLLTVNSETSTFDDSGALVKLNRTEAPIFFRFGFYNYVKVNAERGQKQFLDVRPSVDTWNQYDFLLNWEDGTTKFFVDGEYKHSFVFFEAIDRFWF